MARFEGKNDFTSRALNDTAYLSRIAKAYLEALYTEGGHVWVVPGRLTEMLRRHWGLNFRFGAEASMAKAKNRLDHRHHAIDAAVIAATDRGLIQQIAKLTEDHVDQNREAFAKATPPPWAAFRKDTRAKLETITISHRADHGRIDPKARKRGADTTTGQMHNSTAYGIVDATHVVSRTPLMDLKPKDIELTTKGKNIRDKDLQKALEAATHGVGGKAFDAALQAFAKTPGPYQGIRRLRLIESLGKEARVELPRNAPYKAYKGDSNLCYEIWQLPDGKFKPQVITTFEAHQSTPPRRPHPAAKKIIRIFKRDMVAVEREGQVIICYVQSMHVANGLFLAPSTEANADARNRDKSDPFKFIQMGANPLMKAKLRRVLSMKLAKSETPARRRFEANRFICYAVRVAVAPKAGIWTRSLTSPPMAATSREIAAF